MSLISMHGAWLSFSDAPLLDNAELHIEDNERVCLVGRNGAGKSTLMKILNREQGLDDGRIIYEQDLIVARLQQDPPRNVEGSVYDFVAEGIEEQAEYLKRYHDISRLVMNDPSEKNLNELAKVQEQLDHHERRRCERQRGRQHQPRRLRARRAQHPGRAQRHAQLRVARRDGDDRPRRRLPECQRRHLHVGDPGGR